MVKEMFLEDDSDSEVKIEINKSYAHHYNSWRQKEELQKLKDRYGETVVKNAYNSSDDSSSSEEDENAEQLTEQLEKDFFKTLSCLKKKDPSIYDEKVSFFVNSNSLKPQNQDVSFKKTDNKPIFLRDYERKLIVERNGKLSEDEEECESSSKISLRPASPTIVEEENLIKESFKGALKDSDDDDDDGDDTAVKTWGGLFQKRHKTQEEVEKEEEDYREWLKGQKEELSDKKTESELKYLHDYWNDPKLNSNETFLKDYILNKRFLETNNGDDDDGYIPTYDEIVHDSDEDFSEDEKTIENQEEFEHKFNFRFEEPDKEFIKRYPRTMENSLRKKDDRRKRKRQEVKERKEAEEGQKREELKRLKALKRKEILEKIEKLKQITGNDDIEFKNEDLEGDFDPAEHDKRMRQLFNCEFYEEEQEESEKPEFPELDEELEIENWNAWNGRNYEIENQQNEHELHCEDPDFNMDCDYDPACQLQNELIQSSKGKKKGRKWNKFAQAVSRKKPVFDSNSHTFEEYIDEYYKLDYEDIIGDTPCRFKYRNVVPNSFGLTVGEILKADDKELNQWCSLKKAVQHRPEHVEKYDVHAYEKKALNEQLKKKIFHSIYVTESSEQQTENEEINSKRKRKQKKSRNSYSDNDIELHNSAKKKKKEEVKNDFISQTSKTIENESYDLDSKEESTPSLKNDDPVPILVNEQCSKRKKKKKNKNKEKTTSEQNDEIRHAKSERTVSDQLKVKKHKSNQISKKRYQKHKLHENQDSAISDARLRAYGINPKKYKNKLKYGNK